MTIAQIAAVAIFLLMFVLIIMDKIERHYVTLACGILTLGVVFGLIMHNGSAIVNTLNVKAYLHPISGIPQKRRNHPE